MEDLRLVQGELLDYVESAVADGASAAGRRAAWAALEVQVARTGASPSEALAAALGLVGAAARWLAEACESSPTAVVEHLRGVVLDGAEPEPPQGERAAADGRFRRNGPAQEPGPAEQPSPSVRTEPSSATHP